MGRTLGAKNKPKNPSTSKKPADSPATSSQSSVPEFKKPLPSDIVALVNELDNLDGDKKALADSGKDWIDSLAEKKGLDKKAFAMVRALWKLGQKDAAKLAITLPHLLSYIDDLGLASIADNHRGFEINGESNEPDIEGRESDNPLARIHDAEATDWPDDQQVRSRLSIVPGSDAA